MALKRRQIIALIFLPIFALFVLLLPDATWQTVLITQIVFSPTVLFFFFSGEREKRLTLLIAATALLGLLCAAYLAYVWYTNSTPQCSTDGCQIAQSSTYATFFFGLPTSTVGVVGYLLILSSLLLSNFWGYLLTALLGAFGLAVSLYLSFSSVFVLLTTCQWCLGSATAMTVIALAAYMRFISFPFLSD